MLKKTRSQRKGVPSDAEAERLVSPTFLSQHGPSTAGTVQFEFESKASQLNMRLPAKLLEAVKQQAKRRGIPYTRFIREVLERSLQEDARGREARRP